MTDTHTQYKEKLHCKTRSFITVKIFEYLNFLFWINFHKSFQEIFYLISIFWWIHYLLTNLWQPGIINLSRLARCWGRFLTLSWKGYFCRVEGERGGRISGDNAQTRLCFITYFRSNFLSPIQWKGNWVPETSTRASRRTPWFTFSSSSWRIANFKAKLILGSSRTTLKEKKFKKRFFFIFATC